MIDNHSFDSLKDCPLSVLLRIKREVADQYMDAMQQRWNVIAAILFYQSERDKLRSADQPSREPEHKEDL